MGGVGWDVNVHGKLQKQLMMLLLLLMMMMMMMMMMLLLLMMMMMMMMMLLGGPSRGPDGSKAEDGTASSDLRSMGPPDRARRTCPKHDEHDILN